MKVLVICEIIPEETKKAIVEMTPEEYDFFQHANNKIVNIDELDEVEQLAHDAISIGFSQDENAYSDHIKYGGQECEIAKKFACTFEENKDITNIEDVEKLIHCGFYL